MVLDKAYEGAAYGSFDLTAVDLMYYIPKTFSGSLSRFNSG